MVTITNGVRTFRVTAGAVKPYENMGFRVVAAEDLKDRHVDIAGDSGISPIEDDDVFVTELLEKPLSQWTNEEIKDFVRIKNIDTSGVQKVSQVRNIIKSYLEEEQKNNA